MITASKSPQKPLKPLHHHLKKTLTPIFTIMTMSIESAIIMVKLFRKWPSKKTKPEVSMMMIKSSQIQLAQSKQLLSPGFS